MEVNQLTGRSLPKLAALCLSRSSCLRSEINKVYRQINQWRFTDGMCKTTYFQYWLVGILSKWLIGLTEAMFIIHVYQTLIRKIACHMTHDNQWLTLLRPFLFQNFVEATHSSQESMGVSKMTAHSDKIICEHENQSCCDSSPSIIHDLTVEV